MSWTFYDWNTLPSPQAAREEAETNFLWGRRGQDRLSYGIIITGAARDTGNTGTGGATVILRSGLAMGQITSSLKYTQWDPTATDGSQYLAGFNATQQKMIDGDGNNIDRTGMLVIAGQVKNAKLFQNLNINSFGVTNALRAQAAPRFILDDDLINARRMFPWRGEVSKTANYQVAASDCDVLLDNSGATGAVTFTLPAIANSYGLHYGFLVVADQNVLVSSTEGTNMIVFNNASASTVAFQTVGSRIGGILRVYANPASSKWIVEVPCKNAITIS